MLSKTHITMGIATALIVVKPHDTKSMLIAIAAGALGGVAPDVDIMDNDYEDDALIGQLIAVGIVGLVFVLDYLFKFGIWMEILNDKLLATVGLVVYAILLLFGFMSSHRTFTHSVLAIMLFTFAMAMIYPAAVTFYFAGYFSHLCIDFLNKAGEMLLFPIRLRLCLHLIYANGIGNTVLMLIGLVACVALIINNFIG